MFNYGDVSVEMKEYFARGEKRAKQLDNRGPVVFDKDGKLAIDLGVYGAPETFLIDKEGIIRVRHVGVLTQEVWELKFNSVLSKLKEDEK